MGEYNTSETEDLILAIIQGKADRVRTLLKQGLNPNACLDHADVTPLHYAAQHNAFEISLILIEAGADLQACTKNEHYTPLSIALLFGHIKLARTLLAYMHPHEMVN